MGFRSFFKDVGSTFKDIGGVFKGAFQFVAHGDAQGHGIRDVAKLQVKSVSDTFTKGAVPLLQPKNLHNENITQIVSEGEHVMKGSLDVLSSKNLKETSEWEKKAFHTNIKPLDKIVSGAITAEQKIGTGVHNVAIGSISTFGAVAKPISNIARADVMIAKTGFDVGKTIISNASKIENVLYDVGHFIGEHPYVIIGAGGYVIYRNISK